MHVVVLVKNYLDVQFAEANIKGADDTLQLVVDVSLLFFVQTRRHLLTDRYERTLLSVSETRHLAVQNNRAVPYEDVSTNNMRKSTLNEFLYQQHLVTRVGIGPSYGLSKPFPTVKPCDTLAARGVCRFNNNGESEVRAIRLYLVKRSVGMEGEELRTSESVLMQELSPRIFQPQHLHTLCRIAGQTEALRNNGCGQRCRVGSVGKNAVHLLRSSYLVHSLNVCCTCVVIFVGNILTGIIRQIIAQYCVVAKLLCRLYSYNLLGRTAQQEYFLLFHK